VNASPAARSLLARLEDCGEHDGIISLGLDPGGTTGLAIAGWIPGQRKAWAAWAMQVNMAGAVLLLDSVLSGFRAASGTWLTCAGMELFVPGRSRADPSTRDLCTDLAACAKSHDLILGQWPAATVKPWTLEKDGEKRLKAAGLFTLTAGQPHARDAARPALYAAVHDGGLPDPLSRRLLGDAGGREASHVP
jgi:hypothetical protein